MWSQTRVQTGSEYRYGSEVHRARHNSEWCQLKLQFLHRYWIWPRTKAALNCSQRGFFLQWTSGNEDVGQSSEKSWMLNSLCDVLVHSPRPTPSPTLLCLKKYLARGGWRDVSEMSEFSEMLPSRHVKANVVMNSYQLYLPAKHPYKAKPTKLSLRWGRRCLNHSPYWGAISSW